MINHLLLGGCMLCSCLLASGQSARSPIRAFQFSLTPSVGTNGLHPGGYSNYFSLNLTSGYSRSNLLFEFAVISNLNEEGTRGFQFAGLANITGGNAFASMNQKERLQKVKQGFEANLSGLQVAGITNVVINHVYGGQVAGFSNVAKGALQGVQLSGLANVVHKYSFGFQAAGLFNVSYESMDGVQLAGVWNYTSGGLFGVQIAAVNKVGFIEGRNTYDFHGITALQVGLVNLSGSMDGFQVGLINYSKRMQGTMIGLINIFRNGTLAQTKDGTSVGLINIGSTGYISSYVSEWFLVNLELATGNSKNTRITNSSRNVYIQNALIYSGHMLKAKDGYEPWAIGYGFRKYYFNRSTSPGMSNFRFVSMGMDVMHVNEQQKKWTEKLSLLVRPRLKAGTRLHPKLRSVYVFGAVSWQVFISDTSEALAPDFLPVTIQVNDRPLSMWPGFSAGVHIQ